MGSARAIASSITASSAARSSGRGDTACLVMPLELLRIVILLDLRGSGDRKVKSNRHSADEQPFGSSRGGRQIGRPKNRHLAIRGRNAKCHLSWACRNATATPTASAGPH